jgi:uncharacterized damage-inducible protein DinB
MIDHLQRQFSYDSWANRELISALQAFGTAKPEALRLLAHVLSAQRLWLDRLQSKPQTYPVWPDFSLDQCNREASELDHLWPRYLSALVEKDLAATIDYKNTRGENWSNRCGDILEHVVIHSAHHRGQIVAIIRAAGYAPPTLDFIHAVRQGLLE